MPRRDESGAGGGASLDRLVLEELIYERVRLTVDLCELMGFELDLRASIERALERCAGSLREREELTLDYLSRAWERLSDEVLGEAAAAAAGGDTS